MSITLGSLEIASATDAVRIVSQKISARVDTVAPLRGESAQPRARGRAMVDWQIEVTRLHASLAAAESYMGGLAAAVRTAAAANDASTTLTTATRGNYTWATIVDVDLRSIGATTTVVWTLRTAA